MKLPKYIPNSKVHPWHGIPIGNDVPDVVTAFIEIVPTDTVKYEVDKFSGYIKLDRPHKYSSLCPTLYGFVPQTYCGELVAAEAEKITGRVGIEGDGDPLDICILASCPISHGNIILDAKPIGGFTLLDKSEADDKIIAVLEGDPVYGNITDILDAPKGMIDKLRHYFLTYKEIPTAGNQPIIEIMSVYGKKEASRIIEASRQDYAKLIG